MRTWGLASLLLMLAYCAGTPSEATRTEDRHFPESWPLQSDGDFGPSECASIESTYRSSGQSNSADGEGFSNPIFEQSFFYLNEIADSSNQFKVSVNEEEQRLYFDILDRAGKTLASNLRKTFVECENGWFVIESFSEGGSGESPVQSFYSRTLIGSAEDGSLLINSYVEGEWRENVFGRETRSSSVWYRFQRVAR